MKRKVFYSFHYDGDAFRAQQVRNIGSVEGNSPVSPNKWEEVKSGGKRSIERWIDDNMHGKSCVVVLVGWETADRDWVLYEIEKAWNDGKGLLGIRINKLKDRDGQQDPPGRNPFDEVRDKHGNALSESVQLYSPSSRDSKEVYNEIRENLEDWVEDAIKESEDR